MKYPHSKSSTKERMSSKTMKVISALETLGRLKGSNWAKDRNFIDKCESLIINKTKEVFKDIRNNDYDVFN